MPKKPINVYWSPNYISKEGFDLSFLYPQPETLMSNLLKNKYSDVDNFSFFSCPAVSTKFKKILVFKNSVSCSYAYDTTLDPPIILAKTQEYIGANIIRPQALASGRSIEFDISHMFFSDEPLEAVLTSPFFHEPKHTKYGSVIAGEFDIGQWFRPINFEVQPWKNSGEFVLEDDEPIFYLEFRTKQPILFHRFNMTEKLLSYSTANAQYSSFFGKKIPLVDRYKRFKEVGLREKILTEIKNNLIKEVPYKF